jgi:pimeloyl-ACP methyl ester carboxylesterase
MPIKLSFFYAVFLFPPCVVIGGVISAAFLAILALVGGFNIVKDTVIKTLPENVSPSTDLSNLLKLERMALEAYCLEINTAFDIIRRPMQINFDGYEIPITMHSVVYSKVEGCSSAMDDSDTSKVIIALHGINSGPLFCRKFLKPLIESGYIVHAIALPAFGQSEIHDHATFDTLSPAELLSFYVQFLYSYIQQEKLAKPVLLGHSFGGFVSTKFAILYSFMIKRLILVNSVGFLPTLERSGIYWAMIFKMGFPTNFFRPFGVLLSRFFFSLTLSNKEKPTHEVLLTLLDHVQSSCANNYGAEVGARYINFNPFYSKWNHSLFDDFMNIAARIDLIWGYEDGIIPAHCAKFVIDSLAKFGKTPSLYFIDGWHSPHDDNPCDFNFTLNHILSSDTTLEPGAIIPSTFSLQFTNASSRYGFSTLCQKETGNNIRKLYALVHDGLEESPLLCVPKLFMVKNQNIFVVESVEDEDYVEDFYRRIEKLFKKE